MSLGSKDITVLDEYVDKAANLQFRPFMQKPSIQLYEAARKKQGAPLSKLAADLLAKTVKRGDHVVITTGAGHAESLPHGETDGPPGAAAVARALSLGFGAIPVLVSEEEYLPPITASCEALGMGTEGGSEFLSEKFPHGEAEGKAAAKELVKKYNPAVTVTIERLGPNSKGFIHSLGGLEWGAFHARLEHLVLESTAAKVPTIGVGDGGNELGCGLILEDVRRFAWYGAKCKCPCGDGVATVVATDVLVTGATSNWGSYSIEAALAAKLGREELMHDDDMEESMLEGCVAAGGRDGPTGTPTLAVDGSALDVQQNLVRTLTYLVRNFT